MRGVPLCDPRPGLAQPSALAGMLAADQPPQSAAAAGTPTALLRELPGKPSSAPPPILGLEANVLWDLR